MQHVDLLIIGAGPAGLAAAVEAERGGIQNLLVLEKGPSHSQMIRTFYKEGKRVDARYAGLEAICFGLLCLRDGNRESFLQLMDHVIETHHIPIRYNCEVWSLKPSAQGFEVKTSTREEIEARYVMVAIGRMGKPRQPDYYRQIPMSLRTNGSILFDINTRPLDGKDVLVVGGGDSAAEYAQMLAEKNRVTLSYRQAKFSRLNEVNQRLTEDLIASKRIRALMPSDVASVEDDGGRPRVQFKDGPAETFDAILYGLGGMSPVEFLRTAGVELDPKGEPITNASHESSRPGLYVVGDLLGRGQGGGSIISGFNTATEAVRDLLKKHLGRELPPEVVALDHLQF